MAVQCYPIFGSPPEVKKNQAFVLMPFRNARLNEIYMTIVKPIVESKGLDCLRSDDYETNEVVMKDIWLGISQSKVVIAELTSLNANVIYELGMSHTYGTPTIMIGQPMENGKLPFDFSHIRAIIYNDDPTGRQYLLSRLPKTLDYALANPRGTSGLLHIQPQDSLENHRSTLVDIFIQDYDKALGNLIPVSIFFDGFYSSFFQNFEFGAELLEHFKTGHPDIHTSLNSVLDSEKKSKELAEVLFPKIQSRLRNQFLDIQFQSMLSGEHPTFEDQHLIEYLIENIDLNSTFIAGMDSSVRILISGNEKFKLYNSDQPLADRLALHLTEMIRDPTLRQEIIAYRDNRTLRDDRISALNRTLGIFIKGVKLHTRKLGGTCYQCTTAK
jgi:hypothetical protein